jgi:hypothetical protein
VRGGNQLDEPKIIPKWRTNLPSSPFQGAAVIIGNSRQKSGAEAATNY